MDDRLRRRVPVGVVPVGMPMGTMPVRMAIRIVMRQEVHNEQHPTGLEPIRQPLRSQSRVWEVMEAHPHSGDVEAVVLWPGEGFRNGVGVEEIP